MKNRERHTPLGLTIASALAFGGMALLFFMILAFALPAFTGQEESAVLSWVWQPYQGKFGILPMLAGSIMLAACAIITATPLALGVCCWIVCAPPGPARDAVRGVLGFMSAIPTVVYGFAAVFLITPLARGMLGGSGFCLFSAAVMMALLILPTMALVLEAGLKPRLDALCPEALALGFSRFDLLWFIALPASRKTMLAAFLLGFGRAVGDTLLPLMLAGNAPQLPAGIGESLRTLTAHMALVTANEVGGAAYSSLFAAGALLLLLNTAVSLLARAVSGEKGGERS